MTTRQNGIAAIVFALLAFLCLIFLLATVAKAADGTLTWTLNTEADLSGYHIFRGSTAAVCTGTAPLPVLMVAGAPATVGKVNTFKDVNLPAIDGTLCWEISAFDTTLNESGRSNRVSKVLNSLPPLAPAGLGVVIQ